MQSINNSSTYEGIVKINDDFLLHIIDGFVDEIEIYNIDLTEIAMDFSIDNVIYRIDEMVKLDKNY